jgi:hypothetical protein
MVVPDLLFKMLTSFNQTLINEVNIDSLQHVPHTQLRLTELVGQISTDGFALTQFEIIDLQHR